MTSARGMYPGGQSTLRNLTSGICTELRWLFLWLSVEQTGCFLYHDQIYTHTQKRWSDAIFLHVFFPPMW